MEKFRLKPEETIKEKIYKLKSELKIEEDEVFYNLLLTFVYEQDYKKEEIKVILIQHQP